MEEMGYEIKKAIELGEIWMKKSIDPSHDYTHASRVLEHALNIYKELKPEGITVEMIKLCVWWHDSYKSRCKKITLDTIINEGRYSKDIFLQEVGEYIPDDVKEKVGNSIYQHNRAFNILFNHSKLDDLSMILIEADQLDILNPQRISKARKYMKNIFIYLLDVALVSFAPIFLRIIKKSEYTTMYLKNR